MDESGRKDAEGDSPVEQQGIFSSPDLAVNSENLEEIKPELSEDNKSRIASAFAMTDATQRHDQISEQMEEQGAVSGTVIPANNSTTSTATGDIKIPGAKKRSKLPLILTALVVFVIAGGIIAAALLRKPIQEGPQTPAQSFASYKNLVINGPSNPEDDKNNATTGDGWFLFTVGENGMSADERIQYLTDVSSHFSEFLTTINTSDHVSDNLEKAIETYAQIVTLVIDGKNLGGLSAQLLKKYLDEGASSARTYIDGLAAQLTSLVTSFSTQSVANGIIRYLDNHFYAIEIYQQNGCIVDGEIDYLSCELGVSTTNNTLNQILSARLSAEQTIRDNMPILERLLQEQTGKIEELLTEENNE